MTAPPLRLVDAMPGHIPSLVADARPADRKEWGVGTWEPLSVSLLAALPGRAVLSGDRCVALWGCSSVGQAWFVCTNEAERRVHALHRFFRQGIAEMHRDHPVLTACAFDENTLHHAWMERMGFERTGRLVDYSGGLLRPRYIEFTRSISTPCA